LLPAELEWPHFEPRRAIAGELAVVVGTPSVDIAAGGQRQHVIVAGRNRRHIGEADCKGRERAVEHGAVAQLTIGVLAPRPDGAVGGELCAEKFTGGKLTASPRRLCVGQAASQHGRAHC